MILTLSPLRGLPGQPDTRLAVEGEVLVVDDIAYDLSVTPEGGEARPEGLHPFTGPIRRNSGVIHAGVRVVLGDDALPVQPADPAHWTVSAAAGPVTLPALRLPGESRA